VFGPGSLFTSILPPMLNEGMVREIAASRAIGGKCTWYIFPED